jgi:uncharacterized protein YrzB (UPF0473 family)
MNNNLSDENFIESVEGFTANPIVRKEDVKRLIGIVKDNGKEEEFEKLTFTSKYVCGLMRIIKNSSSIPEVNSIENIKADLNENIKNGMELLREIIASSDDEEKDYIEKTYLTLTTENFGNLNQLFSDLEAVKKYLNYLKRLT